LIGGWQVPGWWRKARRENGWLAVGIDADAIRVAHVYLSSTGRPQAGRWGILSSTEGGTSLSKSARNQELQRYQCTTLLAPGEYQILLVEAPNVMPDELKAAIRWKIKDLLEYHVDDATVDVLEIPGESGTAAQGKPRSMYAIAAPNDVVQKRTAAFELAGLDLKVIDIPEMAQRNIASHLEQPDRTTAMVSLCDWGGLLTFSYGGELLLARRLEVSWDQLEQEDFRKHYLDRVTVEIQRSLEHVERQFHRFPVGELLVAPVPKDVGLIEHLAAALYVPVRAIGLEAVMDFPADSPADSAEQWRFFHLFGAALRMDAKVL